jgi:pimeloyl-ACP methyl ester carboxylesterase
MKKWLRRIALGIAGIIVLVVILGAGYEAAGRRRAARDFPPPGKLVDIGGRRMQIDCRGSGSPIVVLESGLDIYGSLSWATVHDSLARTTRVCAYSRAGVMWSDPRDGSHAARAVAEDLHATLAAAGEKPPFVLVGHSIGGPYVMTYTKLYGPEVAGLVFVDASHPDQVRRLSVVPSSTMAESVRPLKMADALTWTGMPRFVAGRAEAAPGVPDAAMRAINAYASTSLHAMLLEADAADSTFAEAGTFRRLGDRPLFVLTAMKPFPPASLRERKMTPAQGKQWLDLWKEMQDDEASWSSRSQHRLVDDASHYIQLERPDIVIAAVRSVVDSVVNLAAAKVQ